MTAAMPSPPRPAQTMAGATRRRDDPTGRSPGVASSARQRRNVAPVVATGVAAAGPLSVLDGADVLRLFALPTGGDVELDLLTLFEGAVAAALDRREVDEHVVAVFPG